MQIMGSLLQMYLVMIKIDIQEGKKVAKGFKIITNLIFFLIIKFEVFFSYNIEILNCKSDRHFWPPKVVLIQVFFLS